MASTQCRKKKKKKLSQMLCSSSQTVIAERTLGCDLAKYLEVGEDPGLLGCP